MVIIKRLCGIILLVAGMLTIKVNAQTENLILSDTTITTAVAFEATNSIIASNFVIESSGSVTFSSGNYIIFNPVFTIKPGGTTNAFPGSNVGIREENSMYTNGLLVQQNHPNPFTHNTVIRYELANQEHVTIVIYNLSGQKIKTLIAQNQQSGNHTVVWDGKDETGREVSSGIFSYRVETSRYAINKKLVLVK